MIGQNGKQLSYDRPGPYSLVIVNTVFLWNVTDRLEIFLDDLNN